MFYLVSRHSESVAGRLEECCDAKEAAQGRVSFSNIEIDELTGSVLFLKDRVRKRLMAKKSPGAHLVPLDTERDSWEELWAARDTELVGIWVVGGAKSFYVELLKDRLEQQNTSFE